MPLAGHQQKDITTPKLRTTSHRVVFSCTASHYHEFDKVMIMQGHPLIMDDAIDSQGRAIHRKELMCGNRIPIRIDGTCTHMRNNRSLLS